MKSKEFKHKVLKKRIHEITTDKNYSGEASPYWDHMLNDNRGQGEGMDDKQEDAFANPDVMSEEDTVTNRPLTEVGQVMMQAVHETMHELTEQQRTIMHLAKDGVWTEEHGVLYTEQAIADALKITRDNVHMTLSRIKTKIRRRYEKLKTTKD